MNTYDPATNRLTGAEVQTGEGTPVSVDDTSYSYDNDGLITAEADTPAGGPAQVQCFSYDYLGRLTTAWSQGTSGCSEGASQSAEASATAPYWEQYSYNNENDLTSEVSTPAVGAATTTTFGYPAAGSAQPHAVTSAQASGPSGTSATSYAYNGAGDTTSVTSPSDTQTLSWNDAGQLGSVTSTGGADPGTTSYVYDASGNLLLQSDPGSVTLYLPDEQLVENTATGGVTGTRYYSIGGVTVAARSTGGDVQYLTGDQQGTDTLAIDSSTLAVTRRYYDPYGNPIGTPPTTWPGTKGFVGGTTDPGTGLVNLSAREYDSATGSFVSPDPLIDPTNPQDLNAYAYATDDPTTDSDPSGAMVCMPAGPCGSVQSFTDPNGTNHKAGEATNGGGDGNQQPGNPPGSGNGASAAKDHCPYQVCGRQPNVTVKRTPRQVTQRRRSTGSNRCTVADLRFGLDPTCTPAVPNGGGGLPGWLKGFGHPDYVQFCVLNSLCIARARDGSMYVGFQLSISSDGGDDFPVSFSQGHIGGHPTNQQIDSFVNGASAGVTGQIFVGSGSFVNGNPPDLSWDNNDGYETGLSYPPGIGISFWTSHMWHIL